jgi:nucleoside-diphosphate-sugar epimerase
MKVFVAGGSGAIGIPLVRRLVAAGHTVTALTRSDAKAADIRALGAVPAVADALDLEALTQALEAARPTHVIHKLTAIPKEGPKRASDMEATNRLRVEGTRNLLNASIHAGARRIIVGSFAPLGPDANIPPGTNAAADAIRSMESQVLDASKAGLIEAIVLRYGMFYGPESPATIKMVELVRRGWLPAIRNDRGQLPLIHIDDAVTATIAALDHGRAGAAYNIVDDRPVSISEVLDAIAEYTHASRPFRAPAWLVRLLSPYMGRMISLRLRLSNERAREELKWRPVYGNLRHGLFNMLGRDRAA